MTVNEKILLAIYRVIDSGKLDVKAYEDAFRCIRNIDEEAARNGDKELVETNQRCRVKISGGDRAESGVKTSRESTSKSGVKMSRDGGKSGVQTSGGDKAKSGVQISGGEKRGAVSDAGAVDYSLLDAAAVERGASAMPSGWWEYISRDEVHNLRKKIARDMIVLNEMREYDKMAQLSELNRSLLYYTAPVCFDDFLQAIEYDAPINKRFYRPRRKYLKPMVQGYQDILDKKIRLLTVSMPKRAGKSTVELLFCLLLAGRRPDKSILMEGTGDGLVKSFYNGLLEYLTVPSFYHFYDIYPGAKLIQTNAESLILNLNEKSRFPTLMCRSIDARQVGLSEASELLVLDDCVEGREEAKNRARLDAKWEGISGDVMGRALEGTPMVITGTRYSLYDPIGRMQDYAKSRDWKWRAIEIPALDPVSDESNYEWTDHEGKKFFTTKYFREQRDLLSAEQFESEFQQQPFEAKGLLFNKDALNYFYELPVDSDPDAIIAVCDTAEKGSDSTSMGILVIYGSDVYLADVVFDDSPPEITKPQCAKKLVDWKVSTATFESNNAGEYYARDVESLAKSYGGRVSIRTKRTVSNKQTRIEFASDNIIKNFFFKAPTTYERNSQYAAFMKELTTYVRSGKVPHDDAPDMLSLAENEIRNLGGNKAVVIQSPFS